MQLKSKSYLFYFVLLSILIAFQSATPTFATCPSSIIAYWKMDKLNSGGIYVEEIWGTHGTGSDTIVSGTGIVNRAQLFNGTDTAISVPADRLFNWASDESFTIEAWVKFDESPTDYQPIISRFDSGTTLQWWVGVNNDGSGNVLFVLYDSSGNGTTVVPDSTDPDTIDVTDGEWHLVTAVRDEDEGANILYVDGVEQGSATYDYTSGFGSSESIYIGFLNYTTTYYFNGWIDEVALYNDALDESEIGEHYTAGSVNGQDYCLDVAPFAPYPDGTISHWKLDEETSPADSKYVDDFNNNDGTGTSNIVAATGTVDGAQTFNGTDTQINVPVDNSFQWQTNESFSIEAWVKLAETDPATYRPIIGRADGSLQWWVGVNGDGNALFVLYDKTGDGDVVVQDPTDPETIDLTDGQWHHVVAVRDKGVLTGTNILYVDGIEQGSVTKASYTGGFTSATASLNIGWLDYDTGFYFYGDIDEVALYGRALPETEIATHYTEGLDGNGIETLRPEPTADAGDDQTAIFGDTVQLDGSGSVNAASYLWTQTDTTGVTVSLSSSTAANPTFTAPSTAVTLTFRLTVTNEDGQTNSDTVSVTVGETLLEASAGDDQTVAEGDTVTLDGSGSTGDPGTTLSYQWTQTDTTGVTVTLSDSTVVGPTFTAPDVDADTILVFTLTVTDDNQNTDTDTVNVTVSNSTTGGGGGGDDGGTCFITSTFH